MQTKKLTIAHSLYTLYESLPDDIQQAFLQKLFQKQQDKLESSAFYIARREVTDESALHETETSHLDELIRVMTIHEIEEMQEIIEGELPI
ncbi:MAG TPA: hypothetical protein DCQ37_08090 [Desulfobacteraceae bacterium]|nr:hypothetical protein [Desulfobacteraceae bacterium]